MVQACERTAGQRPNTYRDIEFVSVLTEPRGTREIAAIVGCDYRTADERLADLEGRSLVRSKQIGAARAWFLDC